VLFISTLLTAHANYRELNVIQGSSHRGNLESSAIASRSHSASALRKAKGNLFRVVSASSLQPSSHTPAGNRTQDIASTSPHSHGLWGVMFHGHVSVMTVISGILGCLTLLVAFTYLWGRHLLSGATKSQSIAKAVESGSPGDEPPTTPGANEQEIPEESSRKGGLESWRVVWTLLKLWLNDPEYKWKARGLVALVVAHWFVREALWAFILSANNATVINAITELHETKDTAKVKHSLLIWLACELCLAIPCFFVLDPWVSQWFQISFRSHCTSGVLRDYLDGGGQAFYRIKMKEGENKIDNPDQRIGEDIAQIVGQIYNIFASVLSALFGCTMWMAVFLMLGGRGLVLLAVAMSSLRLAIAYGYFGTRLVNAYQGMLWTAADLRYSLTRIREHAEAVALSGGDSRERERSEQYFNTHIGAIRENTWVSMLYNSVMGFVGKFPHVVVWVYQIPAILSGTLHVGDAVRVIQGYEQVTKVLDFFTDQLVPITVLQANAERLNGLRKACHVENMNKVKRGKINDDAQPAEGAPRQVLNQISFATADEGEAFALENVVVTAPGSPVRVGGVSISVPVGKSLLVSGASGLGKSSVLKSLAGLWPNGEGTIKLAKNGEVLVLPHTCYVPQGTLLEVVIYSEKIPSDADQLDMVSKVASSVLSLAGLEPILTRWGLFGDVRDWAIVLSPGERQRVGFARLFLKLEMRKDDAEVSDIVAVLDEATSSVDVSMEATLYAVMQDELSKGRLKAIVSVGHRPTLPQFHDAELQIGAQTVAQKDQDILSHGDWCMPDGDTVPWRHVDL